jgi:hypothetical protein
MKDNQDKEILNEETNATPVEAQGAEATPVAEPTEEKEEGTPEAEG